MNAVFDLEHYIPGLALPTALHVGAADIFKSRRTAEMSMQQTIWLEPF